MQIKWSKFRVILKGGIIIFCLFVWISLNAQNDSHLNKGEMLITNWDPLPEKNAPQINQLNLDYEYLMNNSGEAKFTLKWQVGNYFNYNKKLFLKSELGENNFDNIRIKSITLKANIYSKDKLITYSIIAFLDINLKSGESKEVVNKVKWETLFEKTNAKQAETIFKNGFELRNLIINDITFEGLEIKKETKKLESFIESSNDRPVGESKKNTQEKSVSKKKNILMEYLRNDYKQGQKNSFRGLSWHAQINLGGNFMTYPIMLNSYSEATSNYTTTITKVSYDKKVDALHGWIGGEFWPFFGNYVGMGIHGSAGIGGLSHFSSTMGTTGVTIFIGAKEIKLLGEFSNFFYNGVYRDNEYKEFFGGQSLLIISGKSDPRVNRISFGPRISLMIEKKWFNMNSSGQNNPFDNRIPHLLDIDVLLMIDYSKDFPSSEAFKLWKLNLWIYNKYCFSVEYCNNYPVIGIAKNFLSYDAQAKGKYFSMTLLKTFDFFGKSYLK